MGRPTIADVARAAGVSPSTVSQALNNPEVVAARTRERVHAVIEEVGYVRNASARQLRDGRSRAVGLVVVDANPFTIEVARGVEDALRAEGCVVIFCSSRSSRAREEENLHLLEEQHLEGVLITPVGSAALPVLTRLRTRGSSVVLVSSRTRRKSQCAVWVDDVMGGRLAGEHLVELGHRRIGLINHDRSIAIAADRRAGFLTSLQEADLPLAPTDDIDTTTPSIAAGEEAGARMLEKRRRPTAVFCGNDLLAIGLLRAAAARGLSVPDDLAIVGYDDIVFAEIPAVPLTSVRQPSYELGLRSAQLLLDEVRNTDGHRHEHVVFEPELVVRESTTGRAGEHPDLHPRTADARIAPTTV